MKNLKKILASLLVVVMVLTAAPLSGFVGLELPDFDFGIKASAFAESGQCGDNVFYTYNSSTGELLISGEGPMADYQHSGLSPFYNSSIKNVVINEGVTTIGDYTFYACNNLTSITIPDSVRTIGEYAFSNTGYYNNSFNWENDVLYIGKHLITANYSFAGGYEIKEGTLTIADLAFFGCYNLTSVAIPDSVKTIGYEAFYACHNLTSVTIGSSVTAIGDFAFGYCTNLVELTIAMKEIPAGIFCDLKGLKKVTISEGVERINDEAFSNCSYLETINFPDSLKYMGKDVLKNTAWYNYRGKGLIIYDNWVYGFKGDVPVNYTLSLDKSIKGLAAGIFAGDTNLFEYEVSCDSQYLSVENGVLFNKDKTVLIAYPCIKSNSSYTIPISVEEIYGYAFYDSYNLVDISFGKNLRTIGAHAFYLSAYHSRNVYINDIEAWCKINFVDYASAPMAYGNCSYLYINGVLASCVEIPDGITEINQYAFYSCDNIINISIPDSVIKINKYAIADCRTLESVTLGKGIQVVEDYAFWDCSSLKDVFYPGSQEDWDKVSIGGSNGYLTNVDLFLMHKHDYTVTVTKEPTCTTAGEALYTCVHGDTKIEVIQPLGHTWDEGKITADSSCSKGGTKTYTCTVCFEKKYETIETLDHDYQLRESYAPTCDKVGYDIYVCTQCSAKETRETAPSLGHDFSTEFTVDIDSTCTATGIKTKHCKRTGCKETTEETVIPLKDHAWQSEVTVTKVPTCTAEGESVILCKDCKIVKPESNKVIAPLGHNASEQEFTVDVEATCVSFGKQSKHCTRCNYIEQVTQIPMSEHDYYVAEESTATCNKPGIAIYVCRMCKDSYTVENSPALGHDFEYIIIETPTCTREGYEFGDCTRCDATETRPVPTIDHDYVRTEVSPTCLDDGLATYTCSYGCGTSYDETIPALGHSYPAVWIELLPATCTERGLSVKICSVCSDLQRQILPKLAHADNDGDGACDECGYGKETPDTPEHTHKYSTEVTVAPTCEDKGEMKFICDCGYSYTKEIDALGHTEVIDEAVEATCSSTGLTVGSHCDACGEVILEQEEIPMLGHIDEDGDDICDMCEEEITVVEPEEPEEEPCDCDCHAGGIKAFFFKFLNFFAKLFDKDARTCECGESH